MTKAIDQYKSRVKKFEKKFLDDCKKNLITLKYIDLPSFMYNKKFDRIATKDEIKKSDPNIISRIVVSMKIMPNYYDSFFKEYKFKTIFIKKTYEHALMFDESALIDPNTHQTVYIYIIRFAVGKDNKNYWVSQRIKKLQ